MRDMKLTQLFLFFFLFFIACSYKEQEKSISYNSLQRDTVPLPFISPRTFITYAIDKGHVVFQYIGKDQKLIYRNKDGVIFDSILLPKKYQGEPHLLYTIADSGLYFLDKETNTIEFVGGNRTKQYQYLDTFGVAYSLTSVFFQPQMADHDFLLMSIPNYFIPNDEQRSRYFNSKILGIFSLEGQKVICKKKIAAFPESYRNTFYNSFYPFANNVQKGWVAYIFNNTDSLHLYNIKLDQETVVKLNISNFQMRKFNCDSFTNGYIQNYRITNPYYEGILFDPISKCYAIIQSEGVMEDTLAEGYTYTYIDKSVNIYIFDSSFQTVQKIRFPNKEEHSFYLSYFYDNKLFIPNSIKHVTTALYVYHLHGS